MKKLVRIIRAWVLGFLHEDKKRNYSLSKTFCGNCAGGLPVVFPVYLANYKTGKFFKVLDRQNIQIITAKSGCVAISNHYEPKETQLFQHIIDGSVYNFGFSPITELQYHFEFNLANKDTVLLHTSNLHRA